MASKEDLKDWIVEALRERGGSASLLEVSQSVWEHHEADLRGSGPLFFTWQYDIRWAAQKLRDARVLKPVGGRRRGPWELA